MPTKKPKQPLRGEEAWQAARKEMARRNDAARTRLEAEGAEHKARIANSRIEAERQADVRPDWPPKG